MTSDDYKVVDMPKILSRTVLKRGRGDLKTWIRDDDWYEDTRTTYRSFLKFLVDNQLLIKPLTTALNDAVVRLSDLNDLGQALVRSGADERWIASFDRPDSKKARDDVTYLEKALGRLKRDSISE